MTNVAARGGPDVDPAGSPSGGGDGGFRLGYRPSFDGVRGIGVLLIVAAHSLTPRFEAAGTIALQTFFVLSGFLITVLLVREWDRHGAIGLKNFYLRRALRLLPALVFFLVVSSIVVTLVFPPQARRIHYEASFAVLLYYYNWALIFGWIDAGNFLGHCWSLAVEEQFYLVWPIVLIGLLRLRIRRTWKLAMIALGMLASLASQALLVAEGRPTYRVFIGSDMHADVLLLGCLLGLAANWNMLPTHPAALRRLKVAGAAALLFLLWHSFQWGDEWLLQLVSPRWEAVRVLAIGIMFLTLVAASPKTALWILALPAVVWVGRRSYGIYLWNSAVTYMVTGFALGGFEAGSQRPIALAGGVMSVALAAASFRWVETPFLRMKTRFSSDPAAAVTALAQTAGPASTAL